MLISPALALVVDGPGVLELVADPRDVCLVNTCPWHDVQMGGRLQFEVRSQSASSQPLVSL
jgi:hypothetical protein